MKRTEIRTCVFKLLYQSEFYNSEELKEQFDIFFQDLDNCRTKERKEIEDKVKAILENVSDIDSEINKNAKNWDVDRMNKVDKAILRLAYYEIKFDDQVPDKVAVNEAIELAKEYSSKESFAFVNGVLSKLL